ncbi:MAG: MBL fold metallo-hydrolase [Promethearchaeota archaeon]|nr:MAG: MBL fold metallo-hydrolase [Candidatus Lokiarchaeota archaeon]
MKEVYPGIFLVKEVGRFKTIKPPVNIYLIPGRNGIIFDAGYGDKKTIQKVINKINALKTTYTNKGRDFNISRILISHCHPDHFSGLKRLRRHLKVRIILTEDQAKLIKNKKKYHEAFDGDSYKDYLIIKKGMRGKIRSLFELLLSHFIYRMVYRMTFITHVDELIDNETHIFINGIKWEVIASPGHSSDHISLYNQEIGVLLSGDNVLPSITTWLGPPNSDIRAYIESIERIQNLPNLNIILPAHGKIILNPQERIKEILDHRKERTVQTLKIIKEQGDQGLSPGDIIKALYPDANKVLREFARGWVCLTLKSLEEQNKIIRKEEKNHIRFYSVATNQGL